MKLLSAANTREWDEYTIREEPVLSIDLMERAGQRCADWISNHYPTRVPVAVFCGKGNNGGDGLVIARLLHEQGYIVTIHILEFGYKGTPEFQVNLQRLHQLAVTDIHFIQENSPFPVIANGSLIIDALWGSGINRPLTGLAEALVHHLNNSHAPIIAIDIPSGLFVDQSSAGYTAIHATYTLTFQGMKLAFLLAENEMAIGDVIVLDIGLHPGFYQQLKTRFQLVDTALVTPLFRPRRKFAHKGNFGYALLLAGSYGKMGAAVLAAKACLHSGVGLLTCQVPASGYSILQTTLPEAMVVTDTADRNLSKLATGTEPFASVGVGPGIGTTPATRDILHQLLESYRKPLVIDADALNLLAADPALLQQVPAGSILTPHPKEFDRLAGNSNNDVERIDKVIQLAATINCIVVLKGHYSLIACPDGTGYFNTTGNAGMAKGGSGDVLTGILTALLAQGYPSREAALLGVYLHGRAGDEAAMRYSMEAMTASDIIEQLGTAFMYFAPPPR